MTPTPPHPSVRTIIDVPIPRPRDRTSITDHPAYAGIQKQLVDLLIADHVVEKLDTVAV